MIKYIVSLENANKHLIDVCMVIEQNLESGQEFWLPDWIPGSYMIRDFSKNIVSLSAISNGKSVNLIKKNKSCWILEQNVVSIEISYQIYAWDLSVRSAHFDDQHCFFNGTSVFLGLRGYETLEHSVEIIQPTNSGCEQWKVATSMPSSSINSLGFGLYICKDYANLIDHPFEISDYLEVKFVVNDVEHRMVFTESPKNIDLDRIAKDVQTICQYQCDFFADSKPPFENYLFMTFVQKKGFGGLEHMSSTALHCSHDDLPKIGDDIEKKSKDYQTFLSLCSHEYFHSWNVKRIKPAKFEPYQLQQEVHTELLWFFEGITTYYDELFLVRSGVISKENYLDMLARNITRYMRGNGRKKQTITESSFDAWTKFYKQDENASNAIVSYYVKGGLVAFCLDFEIRRLSNENKNLDDLMRLIWKNYGKNNIGVNERDIQKTTEELVGTSMNDFFKEVLYSTKELDLKSVFNILGLDYLLTSESKQMDKGGFKKTLPQSKPVCSLSITHKSNSIGAEIVSVLDDGSASNIGLSNKDIIIALDGYRVDSSELDKRIASYPLDTEISISFFRRDKLYHRLCRLTASEENTCFLGFSGEKTNSVFNDWIDNR